MESIADLLENLGVIFHKPVKRTVVISSAECKKNDIDLSAILSHINKEDIPILKQHKIGGRNIGLGVEFTYEDFDEYFSNDSKWLISVGKSPYWGEDYLKGYETKEELYYARNNPKYKNWRDKVIIRDKGKCQCCGYEKNNRNVHVHHIFGFKDYPDLRYDVNNGITLCKWCHEKYHSIYGIKGANPYTFGDYIKKYGV